MSKAEPSRTSDGSKVHMSDVMSSTDGASAAETAEPKDMRTLLYTNITVLMD